MVSPETVKSPVIRTFPLMSKWCVGLTPERLIPTKPELLMSIPLPERLYNPRPEMSTAVTSLTSMLSLRLNSVPFNSRSFPAV